MNLGAVLGESVYMPGSSVSVVVSNQIWFPDPYNWAGFFIDVQAQSVHANGHYHVEIYDDTGYDVFDLDGPTDAQGYLMDEGHRGFRVRNYDEVTYEQYPSQYYRIVVATGPGSSGPTPAVATNFIWVETAWPKNESIFPYTQFGIGYMPVFGNPANGGISAVTLQSLIQVVYTAAEAREGGLGAVPGDSQNPFELGSQMDFSQLLYILRHDEVRNFYYFGHGNAKNIGQKGLGKYLDISDFNTALHNWGDPMRPWTQTNAPHPFRFVFLDGCKTADGNLCNAFGIPKIQNMSSNVFYAKGVRYRAFMGWNSAVVQDFVGAINQRHVQFIGEFFDKWLTHRIQGNPVGIRQAIDATSAWSERNHLIIYGYEGLLFNDTVP
ncbi:MAG: hypothetical protein HZA90_25375 [Verrucomicrobia bacterium]|nr:hypothetical protein [Verrucomicrobiota bacterium]